MKIAVGLSGGVDSSVAALLLKQAGHEVVGITMKLWREGRYKGGCRDACFGPGEADDIAAAAAFARQIGIGYHIFDCSEEYENIVLEYFRREKAEGRTPNPCVVCNPRMKFGLLPKIAARHVAFDCFATGHYARIVTLGNRLAIARAKDERKDQSYFLWGLKQEQLGQTMFPLGDMTKAEVRGIAEAAGLPMAGKPDSQDFYAGDSAELLGREDSPGDIVSAEGVVLGRHRGYWHYTVGQRQGLGISGEAPYYVLKIEKEKNKVIVGTRDKTVSTAFHLRNLNWMGIGPTSARIEGFVKIRSGGQPLGPVMFEDGLVRVPGGLFGVTPGQSGVLYSSSGAIFCGGVIE